MKSTTRSSIIAALLFGTVSLTAAANTRLAGSSDTPEVLNADSSTFISTPNGAEAVTDGGFEGGSPNAAWNEFSLNFGTPLCTIGSCGTGTGTGPNSGDWWSWFGGIATYEAGSVDQDVTFPAGGAATLSFFLEAIVCDSAADYMEVNVDGTQVFVIDGSSPLCGVLGYTEQFVNVGAWADGGVHNVEFNSEIFALNQGGSNFFVDDVSLVTEEPPVLARFLVSKNFDDNNPGEVEVTLNCNTGIPLQQTTTISAGNPKNITIGDFEQGALNCTVTEVPVDGYTASYDDGDGISADNCSWAELTGGQYGCVITNNLDESEVEVTKVWIDENPSFNPISYAEAEWECSPVAFCGEGGCFDNGTLEFLGNPGDDSFSVYPDWDGGTSCDITEVSIADGGVEVDDSECQGILLFPGDTASCTIYNTRLYAGIPTLSQYGLGVLVLLMLGVGLVGFRRFV